MILMMMTTLPRHKHGEDDGHGNQCVPLETMRMDEGIVGYVRLRGTPCLLWWRIRLGMKMNKKLTWTSPNRIDIRVTLMIADIGEYILLILQVTTNTGHM
jgi:hypothetical protein